MVVDREALLAKVGQSKKSLGVGELLFLLELHPGQRTELKRVLRDLTREGALHRDGKRFRLAGRTTTPAKAPPIEPTGERTSERPPLIGSHAGRKGERFVVGTLNRHPDGFGFVTPLTGKGDVYLPADEVRRAMDGDLVKVQVVPGHRGRSAGRLIEVVERRRTTAVGSYVSRGEASYVLPSDRGLAGVIGVPPSPLASDGDLVKVQLTRGQTPTAGPRGEIVEVLGQVGDARAEVLEAAYRRGFADDFPADVDAQAETFPLEIPAAEIARRRDLRALPLVTIDGEDARDFDDSVYVERVQRGFRLVVAIADVSHYVRPGTPLDHEALRRATSVYFPNMVLPMLPERLSNGLCSLVPNEDRLCLVADLVFERAGAGVKCVNSEIYEGVLKSAARCTYTEVARVLGGERVPSREHLRENFKLMEELARLLTATRAERGAIDFDLPETRVVLDEAGKRPLKLERRARNIAHRLIEEFMLAANEAVARYFSVRGLPTVYRVHGEPDEERLDVFLALARAHGFSLEAGQEVSGKALNALLKRIAGSPEQRTLNFLMLRSMMQAIYSAENIGHFGLAAPFYLHFTSPIRRYPDLAVHRLLKEHWARGARSLSDGELEAQESLLDGVSARSSERERAAMEAEREIASYFAAILMKDKIGNEYEGTVVAVTDFGFFVELKEEFVEGLVKMASVGEDGELDVERHRIVFPNGLIFGLGTPVKVRVTSVNVARRQIDFELLQIAKAAAAPKPHPKPKPKPHEKPAAKPGKRKAPRRTGRTQRRRKGRR